MKTKIIYISGNELFEMTDIRAAFEEVRSTLGLDKDTILFGVPVDCDNAMDTTKNNTDVADVAECVADAATHEPELTIVENVLPAPAEETVIEPQIINTPEGTEENTIELVAEEDIENESAGKVIPILSVLATKHDDEVVAPKVEEIPEVAIVEEEPMVAEVEEEPIVSEIKETPMVDEVEDESAVVSDTEQAVAIEDEIAQITPEITDIDNIEEISIGDMINDDVPVTETKKTLEELLESMKPLREEINPTPVVDTVEEETIDEFVVMDTDDTDATLAQLASEFAENEDKIIATPKAEAHGKIGKLKNILPFKKAKRDDSSLMGDLFGWAGIAANDDDFAMPGFFSAGGQKK